MTATTIAENAVRLALIGVRDGVNDSGDGIEAHPVRSPKGHESVAYAKGYEVGRTIRETIAAQTLLTFGSDDDIIANARLAAEEAAGHGSNPLRKAADLWTMHYYIRLAQLKVEREGEDS